MGVLGIFLLVLFIIDAIFLILIVMVQDEQGEGIGGLFGGGSATPFGSRSGNILTKVTSILGAIFIVSAFGLAWINKSDKTASSLVQEAEPAWYQVNAEDEVPEGSNIFNTDDEQ